MGLPPERGARLPTLVPCQQGGRRWGSERAPSIWGSCCFAPGGWFGKEGLELVMSRWLSLKAVPRDTVS